jgi:hypothetical protein
LKQDDNDNNELRHTMKKHISRTALATALGAAFAATSAFAEVSDDVIRIGFISDMSGLYRDYDGPAGAEATRTSPTSPPPRHASGSTCRRSTC